MRFRLLAAALAGASWASGCSVGAFDGFSGGEVPAADASTTDAPAGEGGATTDAIGDARGCNGLVCESFDDGDAFSRWSKFQETSSLVEIVSTQSKSAPKALRASIPPVSIVRRAYLQRTFSFDVTHARLSYSLFVEKRPVTGEIEINILRFAGMNGVASDFYLAVREDDAELYEQHIGEDGGYSYGSASLGNAIGTGGWHRVSLEVVLTGRRVMKLSLDGSEIANKPLVANREGKPIVAAGITYAAEDTTEASVFIDDVVFEVLP